MHVGAQKKASGLTVDQCQKLFTMLDIFPSMISSLKLQELISTFTATKKLTEQAVISGNKERSLLEADMLVQLIMAVALTSNRNAESSAFNRILQIVETIHFSKLMEIY